MELQEASSRLARRIEVLPGVHEEFWTAQFTPLIVLYPLLQTEGLGKIRMSRAREALLPHMCLLAHSFIEDRQLDKQIELSADEILFSKTMLLAGLGLSERLCGRSPAGLRFIELLLDRYTAAQLEQHRLMAGALPTELLRERISFVASGRGSLGAIAVLTLAAGAGLSNARLRALLDAFDDLMIGLQWYDDLRDWPEDAPEGRPNFLLSLLLHSARSFGYPPPRDGAPERIGGELLRRGIHAEALAAARSAYGRAITKQRRRGCYLLANLIEERLEAVNAESRKLVQVLSSIFPA